MKRIAQSVCALVLGIALTACGHAKDLKPATDQQPAQQTAEAAQGKSYFPEFDASLLEPITISDQKSPTAMDDLQKYTDMMAKLEPQIIQKRSTLMQDARKQGKKSPAEFKQKLQQWADMYGQLMQKQRDIAISAINEADSLESASLEVLQEYRKQAQEQRQKLEQAMGILQTAMQNLVDKYSS